MTKLKIALRYYGAWNAFARRVLNLNPARNLNLPAQSKSKIKSKSARRPY